MTPIELAQNIFDELYFLDPLGDDRSKQLLEAIVKAIESYGEQQFLAGKHK